MKIRHAKNLMFQAFQFKPGLLLLFLMMFIYSSCGNEPRDNIPIKEHGVFEFLNEENYDDEERELPDYVNSEAVLCYGKGLRVGRCISKQLESDICVGLIKYNMRVIAIEVECDVLHKDSLQVIPTPDYIN